MDCAHLGLAGSIYNRRPSGIYLAVLLDSVLRRAGAAESAQP
jgi:hypothetical protein